MLRPSYRMAVAAAGVLLAGVSSVHAADFSTWQKKMQVRLAGYDGSETLSDFPALVVFTTNIAGFSYSQFLSGTNADLRFTDDSETNELSHEVEYWDASPVAEISLPTAVSGLAVWLKADAGVQTNGSGAVTNWVDQTGNGRHAWQTNASERPQWTSSGIGGKPVIRFDGTDDGLNMGSLSATFPTAATVFVVATLNADNDYNLLTTYNNGGYWRYSGDGKAYGGVFRATRVDAVCPAPNSGSHIFAVESSAAKWEMWIDGDSRGSAATAYYAGEDYRIGRPDGGTADVRNLKGDIAEILIYDRPLSSLEHKQVGACLAKKYGLADMYRHGASFVWVRLPALVNSNTTIRAFWGKSGTIAPEYRTNGAVWSGSYLGAWLMDQTGDTDSSPKRYDGTAQGTVLQMTGKIGAANDFDRSFDYVSVPDKTDFTLLGDYSVSAWVNSDVVGAGQMMVGTYSNAGFMFGIDDAADSKLQFWEGAWRSSSTRVVPGTWSHVAYTRSGTDGRFYINGSNVCTRTDAQATGNGGGLELGGGGVSWASYRFDGKVDQVELAAVKRTPGWIRASWKNQNNPAGFVNFATVRNGGAPMVINLAATNVTATTGRLAASLVSTGLASTVVRVYMGTVDMGTVYSGWWKTNTFPASTSPGLIGTNVSGLVSDSLYFYRYYATNTWGDWWGDPASVFITGEIGVTVPDPAAAEQGTDPMAFSVFRPSWATNAPLVVHYSVGGTAVAGTDYPVQAGTVTIPPGSTNATVSVTPYHDQLTGEGSETVILTLVPAAYRIGSFASATGTIANATTKGWFVSTTGTDTNTGASWSTAYRTISNALMRAQQTAGDEVFVATGTYDTAILMSITNGVRVQGIHGPESTVLNWTGSGTRILSVAHSSAVVEGLTIRGASHGAVYLLDGQFKNCRIADNFAPQVKGGGILMEGGALINCVVSNNVQRDPTWGPGGGIYLQAGMVTQCKIVNNTVNGGGWGGYGVGAGAGVMMRGGVLKNCLITGNQATYTVDGNGNGAGVYQTGGDIINCTIADNQCAASRTGAGMYRTGGTVLNTIIFGNRQGTADQNITGTNSITYSCSPDLAAGVNNNITDNPLFTDVPEDNFHLVGTSLAIDRGQNVWSEGDVDLDGALRVVDGNDDAIPAVDIGCYEAPLMSDQPLCCSFTAVPEIGFNSVNAVLTASAAGADPVISWCGWDFDNNGTFDEQGPGKQIITNSYGHGMWSTRLVVSNASMERATYTRTPAVRVYPTLYYASQSGSNTAPYETLQKAATNIQTVLDFAYAPGTTAITVRVAAGTWTLPARLEITKPLAVRSIAGPASTVLRKPTATRAVFMTHAGAVLDGFTVRDTTQGGIDLQQGVVTNCYIINNMASQVKGGGIFIDTGTLVNSVVSNNWQTDPTWGPGGGVYLQAGRVAMCKIVNNRVQGGGLGGYGVGAGAGVMMRGGVLENCLIFGNQATYTADGNGDGAGVYQTAGRIVNCTIASNRCASSRFGAGIYKTAGTVTNTIVYGNQKGTDDQNITGTNGVFYSCSPDLATNPVTHNINGDPQFVGIATGDCHLLGSSPCIDKGTNLALVVDLDGSTRPIDGNRDVVQVMDMGCYEAPTAESQPLSCSFTVAPGIGFNSVDAVFTAAVGFGNTNVTWFGWDFDNNGSYERQGPGLWVVTNLYGYGQWTVKLAMSNVVPEGAVYSRVDAVRVYPTMLYASQTGSNQIPYNSWAKAAINIQTVIDYAYAPGTPTVTVWVAAGTYTLPARLDIPKALVVRSLYGPEVTILRKPTVTRGVFVAHAKAVFSGFTVQDCAVGGVELQAGTVTNCHIINNTTWTTYGAGLNVSGGTAVNCRVANNSNAGGNWAPGGGVWMSGGLVMNCIITNNLNADGFWANNGAGAGAYLNGGILRNCLVLRNRATSLTQGNAGGVYNAGRVENCTIISNQCAAGLTGGGVFQAAGGSITNSIIWHNLAGTVANDLNSTSRVGYSCSPTLVHGMSGNITNDPVFWKQGTGSFQLFPLSPCLDKGIMRSWMTDAVDLDGRARVFRSRVDMGCYESHYMAGTMVVVW